MTTIIISVKKDVYHEAKLNAITKFDFTTLTICYITKINLYTTSVDTDQCG